LSDKFLMNENAAYIFDVETPRQWTFTGGKTWVAGWFISKTGAIFRDIRAWVDDRPFTGIFGLPRPEIEQKHRGRAGLPYAGFSFLIEPHQGARLLRLELLDHGNHWVEIWRQAIEVTRSSASSHPRLDSQLVPGLIEILLKEQRRHPDSTRAQRAALARTLVLESATDPLLVQPSQPFWGALETPSRGGHTQYGKLPVTGWLIHLEKRIVRITAMADPFMEHSVAIGFNRDDAVQMFPQHAPAATSGFYGMVDLIEDLPNPAWLNVFAELEDGSRHLVFVQRFRQLSCNQKELPYPEFHRQSFWSAVSSGSAPTARASSGQPCWRRTAPSGSARRRAWPIWPSGRSRLTSSGCATTASRPRSRASCRHRRPACNRRVP
jgi:hypothetical protein